MVHARFSFVYVHLFLALIAVGVSGSASARDDCDCACNCGMMNAPTPRAPAFSGRRTLPRDDFGQDEPADMLYGLSIASVDPWSEIRTIIPLSGLRPEREADPRRNVNACTNPDLFWPPVECRR